MKSPLLTRVLDPNDTAAALSRIFLGDGFFRAEATKSGREHKIVLFPLAKDENESLVDAHGDQDAWSQPTAKRRKGVRSAGKIIFTQRTANSGTIDHVWVRETHRGLGFGSILLRQAVRVADLGINRLTLDAEEDCVPQPPGVLLRSHGYAHRTRASSSSCPTRTGPCARCPWRDASMRAV